MGSQGRSNLNVNGRGQDVNWFRDGENIYQYRDWFKAVNYVTERFDITPVQSGTVAYGGQHVFGMF